MYFFEGSSCETRYDPYNACPSCNILVTTGPNDPCNPSPCEYDGICVRKKQNDYICFCSSKYTGKYNQREILF
jgi:hypothetical protein